MNRRRLLTLIGLAPLAPLAAKATVEASPELSPWQGGEPVFLAPGAFGYWRTVHLELVMEHNARVISELVPPIYRDG